MKTIQVLLALLLVGPTFLGYTQNNGSKTFVGGFTLEEEKDLLKIINFFEEQMCGTEGGYKACFDSLFSSIIKDGVNPLLAQINFEELNTLYGSFETDLFDDIFCFSWSLNIEDSIYHKSICPRYNGKYWQLIKELSTRNQALEEYFQIVEIFQDIDRSGEFERIIRRHRQSFDLNDPNIQLLISMNFLLHVDQIVRNELWDDNDPRSCLK